MTFPVLPGEGPMTDETLREIEARLDAATPGPWHKDDGEFGCVTIGDYGWTTPPGVNAPEYDVDSPQGHADAELIAHAPTDLRRLLDEVRRLRIRDEHLTNENEDLKFNRNEVFKYKNQLVADLAEARSECAALTAKVETARQGLADNLAEYEQVIASFGPSKTMCREEEEHRDLARAETAEARSCLAIFDAAMGSGMPHTPAQGCTCHPTDPSTWTRYGDAVEPGSMWEPDPDCPEHGAHTEILPAQEARGDAETAGTGSGRGTSVREPQKPAQATEGWYEFIHPTKATTHIAHVSEHGQVYLPETDLTEEDFYLAAASNRFWRLVRDLASLPVEEGP